VPQESETTDALAFDSKIQKQKPAEYNNNSICSVNIDKGKTYEDKIEIARETPVIFSQKIKGKSEAANENLAISDTVNVSKRKSIFEQKTNAANCKCARCGKTVYKMEELRVDGQVLHAACFKCEHSNCHKKLSTGNFAAISSKYFCKTHYIQLFQQSGGSYDVFGDSGFCKSEIVTSSKPKPSHNGKITAGLSNNKAKPSFHTEDFAWLNRGKSFKYPTTLKKPNSFVKRQQVQKEKENDTVPSKSNSKPQSQQPKKKFQLKTAKSELLIYCQTRISAYPNVTVINFTKSWIDGKAFCALVHSYAPLSIDLQQMERNTSLQNCQLAFSTAETVFGVPKLLDAGDVAGNSFIDAKSIMTYILTLRKKCAGFGQMK